VESVDEFSTQKIRHAGADLRREALDRRKHKAVAALGATYTSLVPQVDADGNDVGGLTLPFLAVPLVRTLVGISTSSEQPLQSFDFLSGLIGSFVPFVRSEKERLASRDSRLSIDERYASRQGYLDQTLAAARAVVGRRLMLEREVQSQGAIEAQQWDTLESRDPAVCGLPS
jgi:hypothetical protein